MTVPEGSRSPDRGNLLGSGAFLKRMRLRAAGSLLLAGVALAALPVTAAYAQSRSHQVRVGGVEFIPPGGPVFAGDQVLWGEQRPDRGITLVAAEPAGERRSLAEFPNEMRGGRLTVSSLAASSLRIGIAIRFRPPPCIKCGGSAEASVFTGGIDRPFERVADRCAIGNPMRDLDVSGDALVARDSACVYSVQEFGGDAESTSLQLPSDIRAPRIAGRYVAWLSKHQMFEGSDVVVFDRVSGLEVYRVDARHFPNRVVGLDLQEDGKVAVVYERVFRRRDGTYTGGERVGWASPQEPWLHRLPLKLAGHYAVRLADDRIAFIRGKSRAVVNGEIGVTNLNGRGRILGFPVDDEAFIERFDFDGQRVAWVQAGCQNAVIRVQPISAPAQIGRARSGCRLLFTHPPKLVRRDLVRVVLDCRGFRGKCGAERVTLRTAGRVRTERGRRRTMWLGTGRTRPRRDLRRLIDVPLSRAGVELLRRRGRLRVRAIATIFDGVGQRERRAATFTLRARR